MDMATPSAAAMATAEVDQSVSMPAISETKNERPPKPDDEQYKKDLAAAEKAHAESQEKYKAIKAKLDTIKGPTKGGPAAERQKELRAQLAEIRQKQGALKANKGNVQDRLKALDANLKSRINEQKTARAKFPFKSEDEVDAEIARLEKQVDSGKLKLVDEKKMLTEISSLRKQRKIFASFTDAQKGIDDVKQQIADLKKGLTDPETKALSDKYEAIAKELDTIKAEQDEAYKGFSTLRDEQTKLQNDQRTKWDALKSLKDTYWTQKKAYNNYEHEQFLARREKQKAEREANEREKRKRIAEQRLEEASAPAFIDEILTAEGLIRYFDPSALPGARTAEPSKFLAAASRTVDESGIKGTLVSKKNQDEEVYFQGGSKKKKGKRSSGSAASGTATPDARFNLSIGVLEQLARIGVEPPMSQADVPGVVEKLKGKVTHWKSDQERKTKENIEKAQKEIARLEAEALNPPEPTTTSSATAAAATTSSGSRRNEKKKSGKQQQNGDAKKDADANGAADADDKKDGAVAELAKKVESVAV